MIQIAKQMSVSVKFSVIDVEGGRFDETTNTEILCHIRCGLIKILPRLETAVLVSNSDASLNVYIDISLNIQGSEKCKVCLFYH
jgi:phage-related holin